MRHVFLALFHLASSCVSVETPAQPERGGPTVAEATSAPVGISGVLLMDARLRGVVIPAHRGAASWGGAVTLLRLAGAEDVHVLVPADGLEPGAHVTLRGALRALDVRETRFHAGLQPGLEASSPLLVALRLEEARIDASEGAAIETVSDLIAVLPPLRVEGTLLGDAFDRSLRVRTRGGSPVCVRIRVVAEEAERFQALEGTEIALEGGVRPDGRPAPSSSADCWTLQGLLLSQPRLVD